MTATPHFEYVWIGEKLIRQMTEQVGLGENIVLLGYRNSGKTHLQNKLAGALRQAESVPVFLARFRDREGIESIDDARIVVERAVSNSSSGKKAGGILSPLDGLGHNRSVLIATNIDSMPFAIARQLLEEVRDRVLSNRLVVVLSGEYYLRELVAGPNSQFNIANHYLIQGLDESEFREEFDRLTDWLKVDWEQSIGKDLYQQTGGNPALLRILLWVVVEWRARAGLLPEKKISMELIRGLLARRPFQELIESEVLRAARRLVPMEPAVWDNLGRLRNGEDVPLPRPGSPPMALTLSGVAIQEGGLLKIASPLMRQFVAGYFNRRRIGDFFALKGDWDKAFSYYRDPHPLPRPASAEDLPGTVAVLRALCSELHRCDDQGPEAVAARFELACRLILGFPHVALWQLDGAWRPVRKISSNETKAGLEVLELADQFAVGELPVPEKWRGRIFATKLRGFRADQPMAITVGDLQSLGVSVDRDGLLRELLTNFANAHEHAINIIASARKLKTRNTHTEIIETLLKAVQVPVKGQQPAQIISTVLRDAASKLCALGYRSVGFWLMDVQQKRMTPLCCIGSELQAEPIALDDPTASLQALVATTGTPIRLPSATRPSLNALIPKQWETYGFAVVPILGTFNRVVGTMWIQMEGLLPPCAGDVDDFLDFGRLLGPIIEKCYRDTLLLTALNSYPDALVVLDHNQTRRYANQVASKLLGLSEGWAVGTAAKVPALRHLSKPIVDALAGRRSAAHVDQFGQNDPSGPWSVVCQPLGDSADGPTGAIVSLQSLAFTYQLLPVLVSLAGAEDPESAQRALLDACKTLRFPAARLYTIEGDKLRGRLQYGFADETAAAMRFKAKEEVLPEDHVCWMCLTEQRPIAFRVSKNGEKFTNASGLSFLSVANPYAPGGDSKRVGDCWIDIPFIISGKRLGKISADCSEEYPPEGFAFLQLFADVGSQVLSATFSRERALARRNDELRKVGERSLGLLAHSLATRLAGLSLLFYSYERLEQEIPSFVQLNESFRFAYEEILQMVRRAKEMLRGIQPVAQEFDLAESLEHTLRRSLIPATWKLTTESHITVCADPVLLSSAFAEIIKNAEEAVASPDLLRLAVTLEQVQNGGQDWARISFQDNGPGVSPEVRVRIFDDFYTHHPGREPGIGLGLGFVRRVVAAHGGDVRECGCSGNGARFVIDIPRATGSIQERREGAFVSGDVGR